MIDWAELECGYYQGDTKPSSQCLKLADARLLKSHPFHDERGSFEVLWDASLFRRFGSNFNPASSAFSYNEKENTLRGMHYQRPPYCQAKLVTCIRGSVIDVIVDLRPHSPSYMRWAATELTASSALSILIPKGFAHGFLTLTDHATMAYLIEGEYQPSAAGVIRWNDPAFGINWPALNPILAQRDRLAEDFVP